MLALLPLISSLLFAQDLSVEEYCFSTTAKTLEIKKRVTFILLPSDKTEINHNCLTVSTASHRRELIQNFIRNIEPNVSMKFSSAESRREPCKIKVEKIIKSKSKNRNATIWPSPQLGQIQQEGGRKEISQISTIKDFELMAYENQIKGECRFINPNLYEIKLEATKFARPIPPVVVLGHNPELLRPKDEKLNHLNTTVQLHRGERMHLGSVLKTSDNEQSAIVSGHTENSLETEEIYLSIE